VAAGTQPAVLVRVEPQVQALLSGRCPIRGDHAVTATHLAITVELVGGAHAQDLWPRPGRVVVAARGTTFHRFADAIDTSFARWDRSHLHMFTLADGVDISPLAWWDGDEPDGMLDGDKVTLSRLKAGEQFGYVFDLGDNWQHLCTVGHRRVDPVETLGIVPDQPLPCWGWGDIPAVDPALVGATAAAAMICRYPHGEDAVRQDGDRGRLLGAVVSGGIVLRGGAGFSSDGFCQVGP
jgi:hypothetical protein